jgi:hypothetical protein
MNGLTEEMARVIAQELCDHAEGGRPDHPRLLGDIDRALWVAQHSAAFRAFVIAAASTGVSPSESSASDTPTPPLCQLCGNPMPEGEEMFTYHGYSGPCPTPAASVPPSAPTFADPEA